MNQPTRSEIGPANSATLTHDLPGCAQMNITIDDLAELALRCCVTIVRKYNPGWE